MSNKLVRSLLWITTNTISPFLFALSAVFLAVEQLFWVACLAGQTSCCPLTMLRDCSMC